jgi:hypothetical protein
MPWLWASFEEYKERVQPVNRDSPTSMRVAHNESWYLSQLQLTDAVHELREATDRLRALGFGDNRSTGLNQKKLAEARELVLGTVIAGETVLLYNKRLALSSEAYGFLHGKDYAERLSTCGTWEINQLVKDAEELLAGIQRQIVEDQGFLLINLDLPKDLLPDFQLAQNLFSVGFDEVGLLIAGRGLEGVLQSIAKTKGLKLNARGKESPAHEADFSDLIEVMYRARWSKDEVRLIDADTRSLLQFLRTMRNSGAHPRHPEQREGRSYRQTAEVVVATVNRIWHDTKRPRARLQTKVIVRDW